MLEPMSSESEDDCENNLATNRRVDNDKLKRVLLS
jgi:hypothetical protein